MTQDETTGRFNFVELAAQHSRLSEQYRESAAMYEGNLANAYRDAAAAHQRLAVALEREAKGTTA